MTRRIQYDLSSDPCTVCPTCIHKVRHEHHQLIFIYLFKRQVIIYDPILLAIQFFTPQNNEILITVLFGRNTCTFDLFILSTTAEEFHSCQKAKVPVAVFVPHLIKIL